MADGQQRLAGIAQQLLERARSAGASQCEVLGDLPRLQQIFWNLLKNASKFTPQHGKIRLRSWNELGRILVEVFDTGRGIDPEALPSIFEAFRQANDTITREFGGLGLGLTISKAAIEAHHGTIRGESRGRDTGSTFIVELPLSQYSPAINK